MSKHTAAAAAAQGSRAGERSRAGEGRERDRISLIAVIHSLHNFSMFSSGGAVEKDTGERRWLQIYDTRNRNTSKRNKHCEFVGYSAGAVYKCNTVRVSVPDPTTHINK